MRQKRGQNEGDQKEMRRTLILFHPVLKGVCVEDHEQSPIDLYVVLLPDPGELAK